MQYFQRLRDLREDRDLPQKAIAQILQTSQQQYARWESGYFQMPIEHYKTLARYYNVSLDYLAGLTETPRTLDGSPYSTKTYSIKQKGTITNNFN